MSVSVCMCVCMCVCLSIRDHIFGTTRPSFNKFFVHVTGGRGSVLLSRRSDMLCTAGLWTTSYLLISQGCRRRRPVEAPCTRSLGRGYKLCAVIPDAGQRTQGTTFRALKVTFQMATPGAESAVYDCLVEEVPWFITRK